MAAQQQPWDGMRDTSRQGTAIRFGLMAEMMEAAQSRAAKCLSVPSQHMVWILSGEAEHYGEKNCNLPEH